MSSPRSLGLIPPLKIGSGRKWIPLNGQETKDSDTKE